MPATCPFAGDAAPLTHQYWELSQDPEFGPDGYLHLEPFTQKPVADLWELNVWTGDQLKLAFAHFLQPA